jgi:hypothetical protein
MFSANKFSRFIPVSGTTGSENPHRPLPETPRSSRYAGWRLRATFAAAVLSICAPSCRPRTSAIRGDCSQVRK